MHWDGLEVRTRNSWLRTIIYLSGHIGGGLFINVERTVSFFDLRNGLIRVHLLRNIFYFIVMCVSYCDLSANLGNISLKQHTRDPVITDIIQQLGVLGAIGIRREYSFEIIR